MPSKRVTYDTIRTQALKLPGVEEALSYGAPALKIKKTMFARLREELDSVALRMPFDRRDELIEAEPGIYYTNDHYRDYPYVLVHLSKVRADAIPGLLRLSYDAAASAKPPRKKLR